MMKVSLKKATQQLIDSSIESFFKEEYSLVVNHSIHSAINVLARVGKKMNIFSATKDPEKSGLIFNMKVLEKTYANKLGSRKTKSKRNNGSLMWKEITEVDYNIQKHGMQSIEATFEFNQKAIYLLIGDALNMYWQITSELSTPMLLFNLWVIRTHPNLMTEGLSLKIKNYLRGITFQKELITKADYIEKINSFKRNGFNGIVSKGAE